MTDTAIPDDDDIASLASFSFESVQPSSLQLPGSPPCGGGCSLPAMALPRDHVDQLLRCPVSPDDLQLENILDDNGVSGQLVDGWHWSGIPFGAVSRRSRLPQRCRGSTDASALSFSVIFPQQLTCRSTALFSQQLLDLTHRWWTEREDPDIDINGVSLLAAAVCIHIKLHSARGFKRARDIAAPAHLGALIAAKPRIKGVIRDAVPASPLPERILETRLSEVIETATSTFLRSVSCWRWLFRMT